MLAVDLLVPIVAVAIGLVLVVFGVRAARPVLAARRSPPGRHLVDASDPALVPPPYGRDLVHELAELGFRRLGETQLTEGDRRDPLVEFSFVDTTAAVHAAIVAPPGQLAVAAFYSYLRDGTVIETGYGIGERAIEARYIADVIESSLAEALARHRSMLAEASATHGGAHRFETIDDKIRLDRLYRSQGALPAGAVDIEDVLPIVLGLGLGGLLLIAGVGGLVRVLVA